MEAVNQEVSHEVVRLGMIRTGMAILTGDENSLDILTLGPTPPLGPTPHLTKDMGRRCEVLTWIGRERGY